MTNEEALKFIQDQIKANPVVLFMKGSPDFPMCGFSGRVVQILNSLGVKFEGINILDDENLRSAIKQFSNWPTIPQLYVKEEFIGGCDITTEMAQKGELAQLFKDKGIVS
ncbi:MAG: Grx4 family monothiol glutaredoxin [Bdellovibrionota bacterium]